jgi:hypothetical protein
VSEGAERVSGVGRVRAWTRESVHVVRGSSGREGEGSPVRRRGVAGAEGEGGGASPGSPAPRVRQPRLIPHLRRCECHLCRCIVNRDDSVHRAGISANTGRKNEQARRPVSLIFVASEATIARRSCGSMWARTVSLESPVNPRKIIQLHQLIHDEMLLKALALGT